MYYKKQSFLVAGVSRSGVAAAEFLLSRGAEVYLYDDMPASAPEMSRLAEKGAHVVSDPVDTCDALVLSPGIPIDHAIPVSYRRAGKRILGECEIAARILRAPAVGVTGTNGKTTTVSLLGEIAAAAGMPHTLCGNIGTPLLAVAEKLTYDDLAIVEISSFQLETLRSFMPHIAIVTNVTEDHLDRHYNMENYTFLKSKLVKNLTESEYAVLNYDDPIVRSFAEKTKAKVVWFSAEGQCEGAYLSDRVLYYGAEEILPVDRLCMQGKHNVMNALACVAAAKILGVDSESIRQGLTSFRGVKHRNEFVREVGGVKYVNDSKGTNADATIKAIENLSGEAVLMLGGRDKGYDYDRLFEAIKRSGVVHTVLYGENRMKLVKSAVKADYSEVTVCGGMELAFSLASKIARAGQTVLFSPASASFDEFENYEQRGEKFVALVNAL